MAESSPPKRDPMFLIIAGALIALFLPFALAFPRGFLMKAAAVAALIIGAAGVSALLAVLRRRKKP